MKGGCGGDVARARRSAIEPRRQARVAGFRPAGDAGNQWTGCASGPGEVSFETAEARTVKNAGHPQCVSCRSIFKRLGRLKCGAIRVVAQLQVLLDNQYARVYDIRIPAGTREPRHTHKNRVVVCLSAPSCAILCRMAMKNRRRSRRARSRGGWVAHTSGRTSARRIFGRLRWNQSKPPE